MWGQHFFVLNSCKTAAENDPSKCTKSSGHPVARTIAVVVATLETSHVQLWNHKWFDFYEAVSNHQSWLLLQELLCANYFHRSIVFKTFAYTRSFLPTCCNLQCDLVLLDAPDFAMGLGLTIHVRTFIWYSTYSNCRWCLHEQCGVCNLCRMGIAAAIFLFLYNLHAPNSSPNCSHLNSEITRSLKMPPFVLDRIFSKLVAGDSTPGITFRLKSYLFLLNTRA